MPDFLPILSYCRYLNKRTCYYDCVFPMFETWDNLFSRVAFSEEIEYSVICAHYILRLWPTWIKSVEERGFSRKSKMKNWWEELGWLYNKNNLCPPASFALWLIVEQTIKLMEHQSTGEGLHSRLVCSESNNRYRNLEFSCENWRYHSRVFGEY